MTANRQCTPIQPKTHLKEESAMRRSEKKKKWILYAAVLLLCLTAASVYAVGTLQARYSSRASGSGGASVALWASTQTVTLNGTLPAQPGGSCTYPISVSNTKDGKTCEVSQSYSITVKTAGNLPLSFSLTRDGTEVGTFTESAGAPDWTVEADDMAFPAGTAGTHNYVLTVTWPAGQTDEALMGLPDFIQIDITARQID